MTNATDLALTQAALLLSKCIEHLDGERLDDLLSICHDLKRLREALDKNAS